jgi:hypothetical protein
MEKTRLFKAIVAVAVGASVLTPALVSAIAVSTPVPVTITQSYAYASYDGGDFVFSTSAAVSGCASGWYVQPSDPGYKIIVSVVLTAQAAGLQVMVYGDNSQLWSGAPSGQYCHIQTVGISS